MPGARGEMADFTAVERDAIAAAGFRRKIVSTAAAPARRSERDFERHDTPVVPGGVDAGFEMPAHFGKDAGVGALKAVDRLLRITDGEHLARTVARPSPAEEFLRQRGNDLPLLGVGVLGLVDQNVVDAAVELEEHPWRDPGRCSRSSAIATRSS